MVRTMKNTLNEYLNKNPLTKDVLFFIPHIFTFKKHYKFLKKTEIWTKKEIMEFIQ